MNRKENEILDIQTGKIKLTQEEIKRREEKEKQRKIENRKRFLIVTSSVLAMALMITGIVVFNNWNIKHKADVAAIAADKALWPKGIVMPTKAEIAQIKEEVVVFETSMGTIKMELDVEAAPLTVMNFRKLVNDKFYDGSIFHRVIKDFMIQGGGFDEKAQKDPGYVFKDEINAKALELTDEQITTNEQPPLGFKYDESLKSFKMTQGVLAMANTGKPNTNNSQFFIITAKEGTPWLNGLHTAFGRVVEGLDVALKIQDVKVNINKDDPNDVKPLVNVVIKKAYIEKRVKK